MRFRQRARQLKSARGLLAAGAASTQARFRPRGSRRHQCLESARLPYIAIGPVWRFTRPGPMITAHGSKIGSRRLGCTSSATGAARPVARARSSAPARSDHARRHRHQCDCKPGFYRQSAGTLSAFQPAACAATRPPSVELQRRRSRPGAAHMQNRISPGWAQHRPRSRQTSPSSDRFGRVSLTTTCCYAGFGTLLCT